MSTFGSMLSVKVSFKSDTSCHLKVLARLAATAFSMCVDSAATTSIGAAAEKAISSSLLLLALPFTQNNCQYNQINMINHNERFLPPYFQRAISLNECRSPLHRCCARAPEQQEPDRRPLAVKVTLYCPRMLVQPADAQSGECQPAGAGPSCCRGRLVLAPSVYENQC